MRRNKRKISFLLSLMMIILSITQSSGTAFAANPADSSAIVAEQAESGNTAELEEAGDIELEEAGDIELEEAGDIELEEAADIEPEEAKADMTAEPEELEEAFTMVMEETKPEVSVSQGGTTQEGPIPTVSDSDIKEDSPLTEDNSSAEEDSLLIDPGREQEESHILADTGSVIAEDNYYEFALKLKKRTTTIYTTQKKVAVAAVKFSDRTTARDNIKVEDITYSSLRDKKYALEFEKVGQDLIIYASADEDTALGKHVIKVSADTTEEMQASEATITVNVVQGIEEGMLSMTVPSNSYYKQDGKKLSFKVKAVYSKDDDSAKAAKKRKVSWEIVSPDRISISGNSPLYGKVSIENGKVTVNKDYVPSETKGNNRFVIKMQARDFAQNTVCVYSDVIEIRNQKYEPQEVIIIKKDVSGNGYVTARSNSSITSDLLGQIRVLKQGAPIKDTYLREELELYTLNPLDLTYKASKAFTIDEQGNITAKKPVKKANITVTLNDSSKQKAVLKNLAVVYENTSGLGLKIEKMDKSGQFVYVGDSLSGSSVWNIDAPTNVKLRITVMKKNTEDGRWEEVDAHVNYGLTTKNGKIIYKEGDCNQRYYVGMAKKSLTINLNDKARKEKVTYTINNTSYPEGKGPTLSAKGSLIATAVDRVQTITYTLKKNGKFTYNSADKHVLIEADYTDKYKNDKKLASYTAFEEAMGGLGYYEIKDNQVSVSFNTCESTPLPDGKFKLWFTFGYLDKDGIFSTETQMRAVTITVKKDNLAKGTFTPVTNYHFSVKEGGVVDIKGKGKYFDKNSISYKSLKNANVLGKPNSFKEYFEIENRVLKLKSSLTLEDIDYLRSKAAKNHLWGYVDYSVSLRNNDGTYSTHEKTAKIRLTMKESVRPFTINELHSPDDETVIKTRVYAGGRPVNIIHAYVAKGTYTIEATGDSFVFLTPNKGTNTPEEGANILTIYVVPDTTIDLYSARLDVLKSAWENASGQAKTTALNAYNNAIREYGIRVVTKVILPVISLGNRDHLFKVVDLVNAERKKVGLPALTVNEDIMYAAYVRSVELTRSFKHERPNKTTFNTILDENHVSYRTAGENIAKGQRTPEEVMSAWMKSDGHKKNILSKDFTQIGVGCYEKNGTYYWVQLFIQ